MFEIQANKLLEGALLYRRSVFKKHYPLKEYINTTETDGAEGSFRLIDGEERSPDPASKADENQGGECFCICSI